MLNKMKSSIAYSRVEASARNAKKKVQEKVTPKNVIKTVCKVSSAKNTVKSGACVVGGIAGAITPGTAVVGTIYYGGKAVCHGSVAKMMDKEKEDKR